MTLPGTNKPAHDDARELARKVHDVFSALRLALQQDPTPQNAATVLQIIADFQRDSFAPLLAPDAPHDMVITVAEQATGNAIIGFSVDFAELRAFVQPRCVHELRRIKEAESAYQHATSSAERFIQAQALLAAHTATMAPILAVVAQHADAPAFALQMLASMIANIAAMHSLGAPSSKN